MRGLATIVCWIPLFFSGAELLSAADFQPGRHDALVVEELRSMIQTAPLRSTTVRDVAPDFVMEKDRDLSWEEALAEANRRFGQRQPQRALFLRKYLTAGAPEARLAELHWMDRGFGLTSGYTLYGMLEWCGEQPVTLQSPSGGSAGVSLTVPGRAPAKYAPLEIKSREGNTVSIDQNAAIAKFPKPLARIDTAVRDHALVNVPRLSFPDITVKAVLFSLLTFDENDQLVSAMEEVSPGTGEPAIRLSCFAGSDGLRYSASISDAAGDSEMLDYSPDLVLRARWVQLGGRMAYHELYEAGRLRKRVHTEGPQLDANGHRIESVETFP